MSGIVDIELWEPVPTIRRPGPEKTVTILAPPPYKTGDLIYPYVKARE